jgi:uncharacterized protein CbrC (UPF0167 family)
VPENLPTAVLDEISHRTPGYFAGQESHWLYHCGDGAAYLGRAGWEQIRGGAGALQALQIDPADPDRANFAERESIDLLNHPMTCTSLRQLLAIAVSERPQIAWQVAEGAA